MCAVWVGRRLTLWALAISVFWIGRRFGFFAGDLWSAWVAAPSALWLVPLAHTLVPLLEYRTWGYRLREHDLLVRRGLLTREVVSVPLARIQQVDSSRGPIERLLELTTLVVHTAGTRAARTRLPGIGRVRAEELRDRLGREAHERAE